MSLANGRHYLAIPGPSVMPDRVLQAMHRAAPNIYTGGLVDMVDSLFPDLKAVARTEAHCAIYICNGHGVWEAALANTCSRGDTILVLSTGMFASSWAEMARRMAIEVEIIDFGARTDIATDLVEEALRADKAGVIKAVLAVQVDTSSSVRNDIPALSQAIRNTGHPALLMVDCIACLGCDDFRMDEWGVDVMMTGSQKGLMTPPGMGFLFFNDKADAARATADLATSYWDWRPRVFGNQFYQNFCGTAPTHHLYGLREALTMIVHEEGLDTVLKRHAGLAKAIWAAVEIWGQEGEIELNIPDEAKRSHAVTTLRMTAPNGTRLREWMEQNAGVTLGIGLGFADSDDPEWHGFFRIGHMGHVNAHMVMGVLACMDAGLKALDIPHGIGALEAAALVTAQS